MRAAFLALLGTGSAAAARASAAAATVTVNCDSGSDASGDGSSAKPFRTLMRARDAVRALQPLPGPVSVQVVAGTTCFPRDADGSLNFSAPVLTLAPEDSGTATALVTWTSTDPSAPAPRLQAGMPIPAALWAPTPGRPGVFQADLGPTGLDVARYGYGSLAAGGLGTCAETAMELFFNAAPMTVARYPNISPNGTWQWMNIASVDNANSAFTVNGTAAARALTWVGEPAAWLHGYWVRRPRRLRSPL